MVWDSFFLCMIRNHVNLIFISKKSDRKMMIIKKFHIFQQNEKKILKFFSETPIFLFIVKIDLTLLQCKLEKIIFHQVINVWRWKIDIFIWTYGFFCACLHVDDCVVLTLIPVCNICKSFINISQVYQKLWTHSRYPILLKRKGIMIKNLFLNKSFILKENDLDYIKYIDSIILQYCIHLCDIKLL